MRLDIVMPAHNEEERIGRTLRAYRDACPQASVRFLVALDSCTDRTPEIVRAHQRADERVQSFEYPKLGKSGVIAETFSRSDAELVGFVDADCATPPRELLRLAEAARRTDGAIASRRHPASMLPARRPLAREITSAGFAGSVRMLIGLPYRDTQCRAKVLRRHACGGPTGCSRGAGRTAAWPIPSRPPTPTSTPRVPCSSRPSGSRSLVTRTRGARSGARSRRT